ncbi:probable cyclic nucleotide-gated ion channel 14 [Impatiens glandulifera]|uniref:probable cyclic nucleotide-gated ion channel 14 n=1 Tax=Impatiens glandulifera TaxID=253017 RepID=UPI001FB13006|nr:probable cyclic nucleotide-gated ion channel 14 [Impatiens glandulifera]
MEMKKQKLVRFYKDGKLHPENSWVNNEKQLPVFKSEAIGNGNVEFGKSKVLPTGNHEGWRYTILDPGSEVFLKWNRIFMFSCLMALFVDPLFFYLPSVINGGDGKSSCMTTDLNLGITVTCFRTLADLFYLLHVIVKFRTAYVSPKTRVFGRGELVKDPKMIALRYLKSDFFVDAIATLPLPQIVIWFIIPAIKSSHADHTNNAIVLIVLLQYIPRLYLVFPLSSEIIKAAGVVTKTAWAGAAYNLMLYMLASHILGASWYLLSIERQASCWKSACRHESSPTKCSLGFLDCGSLNDASRVAWANVTAVFGNCDPSNDNISFKFGIFGNAVTNGVVSTKFLEKYFYCLWWGLQNLSSYGQSLQTSTFIGETVFAILIAILGLVLFAHLIGNMQTYLQSITVRLEEWRLRRRDTEEWMRHRQLPPDLQERVRRFIQYKWLATRGVHEETILHGLPTDLRRDIQRHLCLDLIKRVPFFSQMDDQLLDAICERLGSSLSTQGTCIVREGDPVNEMQFIIRGRLESSTTNGGRTGFFNSTTLRQGDFCGEELLSWALLPKPGVNLPSSTRTVRALVEVEAFVLLAEDLKFVANQFRRLHSKKLQHTFRYYSHHWRAWAACFIQAAWRRHKKRKTAHSLSLRESFSYMNPDDEEEEVATILEDTQNVIANNSSQAKQNIGILASRFAANTRKGALKAKDVGLPKLKKPEEPDFSVEPDED